MGRGIPMRNAGEADWKACVKKASAHLSKKQIKRWKLDLKADKALESDALGGTIGGRVQS